MYFYLSPSGCFFICFPVGVVFICLPLGESLTCLLRENKENINLSFDANACVDGLAFIKFTKNYSFTLFWNNRRF